MRRFKQLTDHDRAAWATYARDITLLPGQTRPDLPHLPQTIARPDDAAPLPSKPRLKQHAVPLVTGSHPPGLDKATWNRLQGGKLVPARTLDLHGKTTQAAFHALDRFLHAAQADRLRCIEIITGRGTGETGGVIRRELPMWLNLPHFRPAILAVVHPHAANPGAVRLLLRRSKS